jgi:hypothetical protein
LHDPAELTWAFDGGPNDKAWTWSCLKNGQVIRRSDRAFPSLTLCVLDAVRHRVAAHPPAHARLH